MNCKILNQRTWLNLFSAIIMVVGLVSAALIYQRADNTPYGALGYEVVDGITYPIMPEDSKQYLRDLELYGGKANVLMDKFNRWFLGLWHGKSLAVIIGCTSIIISFGFYYAANHLNQHLDSDVHNEDNHDGTG
jgi:hypothetical protein